MSSLALLFKFTLDRPCRILDLGTGGGLPGIPLAIVLEDSTITLLDATRKKITAVEQIVSAIGLKNVRPVWGRAEECAAGPDFRASFEYVIVRAVGPIKNLLAWSRPFLKPWNGTPLPDPVTRGDKGVIPSGSLILLKGGDLDAELNEAERKYSPRQIRNYPLNVEGSSVENLVDKRLVLIIP